MGGCRRQNLLKLKTGIIDARDFKTMRDLMPALGIIDLKEAVIVAYTGTEGTAPDDAAMVPARIKKQGDILCLKELKPWLKSAARAVKRLMLRIRPTKYPKMLFIVMWTMEKQVLPITGPAPPLNYRRGGFPEYRFNSRYTARNDLFYRRLGFSGNKFANNYAACIGY